MRPLPFNVKVSTLGPTMYYQDRFAPCIRRPHLSRRCIPLALLCCASLLAMPRTQAGVWAADSHAEQPYPIAPSLPANIRDFLSTEVSGPVFNVEHHYGRIAPASN